MQVVPSHHLHILLPQRHEDTEGGPPLHRTHYDSRNGHWVLKNTTIEQGVGETGCIIALITLGSLSNVRELTQLLLEGWCRHGGSIAHVVFGVKLME